MSRTLRKRARAAIAIAAICWIGVLLGRLVSPQGYSGSNVHSMPPRQWGFGRFTVYIAACGPGVSRVTPASEVTRLGFVEIWHDIPQPGRP